MNDSSTILDSSDKMQALEALLSSATAETLTLSDQHVSFLLTRQKGGDEDSNASGIKSQEDSKDEKSLLKMTVIPAHKELLSSTLVARDTNSPEHNGTNNADAIKSSRNLIAVFLSQYEYQLTNESGAEYSYFLATPQCVKYTSSNLEEPPLYTCKFNVELISPASERQIARAMPSPGRSLTIETVEIYENVTKPYIQDIVNSGSLSWVQNIISGKKEKERLLFENEDWLLNIDTKWRSHPDPLTIPRTEWQKNSLAIADLYCLGISKHNDVTSLRDLRRKHLAMLQSMYKQGLKTIRELYGVEPSQIRVFVHYQPQFYHFHVHFTRLHNEIGCQVERGHLLTDIIQNLESNDEYYKNRDIAYVLSHNDKLFSLIETARSEGKFKIQDDDMLAGG